MARGEKESLVVDSAMFACNDVCAEFKKRGLPHDSVWLYLAHFMKHLEFDTCFAAEDKEVIRHLFDEYISLIDSVEKNKRREGFGADFLHEIQQIKRNSTIQAINDERKFATQLLESVNKNIDRLRKALTPTDTPSAIKKSKDETLLAINSANSKDEILQAVERGFAEISVNVRQNQERIQGIVANLFDLEAKAILDKLTGIFNRRFFDQELPRVIKAFLENKGRYPFAMVIFDLDRFKNINDTYGHSVGDLALQNVAEIIQKNSRAGIDSPIRIGGDEFALFIIGADKDIALRKAQRICREVTERGVVVSKASDGGGIEPVKVPLYLSGGICEIDYGWHDIAMKKLVGVPCPDMVDLPGPLAKMCCMLRESADEALYRAKRNGRNQLQVFEYIEKSF